MFLKVSSESNSSHPKVRTHTVFMWPKTWKETAEKRPMQRYWLILQNTARVHERRMNICTDLQRPQVNNPTLYAKQKHLNSTQKRAITYNGTGRQLKVGYQLPTEIVINKWTKNY